MVGEDLCEGFVDAGGGCSFKGGSSGEVAIVEGSVAVVAGVELPGGDTPFVSIGRKHSYNCFCYLLLINRKSCIFPIKNLNID